jgi:hypothetical protein
MLTRTAWSAEIIFRHRRRLLHGCRGRLSWGRLGGSFRGIGDPFGEVRSQAPRGVPLQELQTLREVA